MKRRRTIAFLTSGIGDVFSVLLSRGIMSASANDDVNILIVPLKYINRERTEDVDPYEYQYQTATAFLKKDNVDAFIVAAECIGCLTTRENTLKFVADLEDVPTILVASKIDGYPSVNFDNKTGIRDGLNFLIERMGVHKICMLGGFTGNSDSEERFQVYREVLKEHDIPFYDSYYVESPLSHDIREEAARLLDQNPDTEAVFCANDKVAYGLYAEMKSRGLVPGKDIYIMGFDNEEDSAMINPSLSTVVADPVELGRYSYDMVKRMLDGEEVQEETIPTRFIPRDSFGGIASRELQDRGNYLDPSKADSFFNMLFYRYTEEVEKKDGSRIRELFCNLMVNTANHLNKVLGYSSADGVSQYDEAESAAFLKQMSDDVDDLFKAGALKYTDVDEFVSFLEHFHAAVINEDVAQDAKTHSSDVMYLFMKQIIKVMRNRNVEMTQETNDMMIDLKNLVRESLNFVYGNDHSYSALISNVGWLGIQNAYIYIYSKPIVHLQDEPVETAKALRMKAALRDGKLVEIPYSVQYTKLKDMFCNPRMTDKKYTLILTSLFCGDTLFGAILYDATELTFRNGDFLTNQFGSAAHMIHILKQNNEIQKQLEDNLAIMSKNNIELDKLSRNDVLTGILNRRGFNALAESVIKDNRELGRDTIISYVDMNNLKVINDRFGHDDGDFALKAVSTLLTEIIGNRGVVGRIGGDEYAFVYYGDKDEKQLKEEVRRRFAEFNKSTDVPYNVTVSCGFYRIAKDDTERTLDDAMGMADQDLYIAKQMKDNRVLKAL